MSKDLAFGSEQTQAQTSTLKRKHKRDDSLEAVEHDQGRKKPAISPLGQDQNLSKAHRQDNAATALQTPDVSTSAATNLRLRQSEVEEQDENIYKQGLEGLDGYGATDTAQKHETKPNGQDNARHNAHVGMNEASDAHASHNPGSIDIDETIDSDTDISELCRRTVAVSIGGREKHSQPEQEKKIAEWRARGVHLRVHQGLQKRHRDKSKNREEP
ncbi:MAG: hypothetical protein L6R39_000022 [Caloplaca ligustica]|nr:MAG: hypothetical protein L6R39_000022 [Caloplaca ligustica]